MKRAGWLLACGVVLGLLWQPIASAEQLPLAGSRPTVVSRNALQMPCVEAPGQYWQLERKLDGFYRLRCLLGDRDDCLEIANGSGTIGTDVTVADCRDSDNALQQWYFDDTGHGFHRLVVKQANLALEVENSNGGLGPNVVGGYRRDGDHQAGNLTQAAKWPPQQWQLRSTLASVVEAVLAQPANGAGQFERWLKP